MTIISEDGTLRSDEHMIAQPYPLVQLEPGDGYAYSVGAFAIGINRQVRLLFVFGSASGRDTKPSYVLDQHPATINLDTFLRLFESSGLLPSQMLIGWLALRALAGLPVGLEDISRGNIERFERLSGMPGATDHLFRRLRPDWTSQLDGLRAHLGLLDILS